MAKKLKIVTIGGGSSYTPELIEGFIKRKDRIIIDEFWLVDIEEGSEKLEIIYELTKRMFAKAKMDTKVYRTTNRQEAILNADFVTTQFRVGQLEARKYDEKIPNSLGLLGQETNGAGGMFKALRTVPIVLDIIRDVQKLAPNAFVINFTNPAGIVSEAVNRYTNFKKFIGVCNVPIHMKFDLAKALDVEEDRLQINFLGLNHMVFGLKTFLDGKDISQKAINTTIQKSITMQNIDDIPFNERFIKQLGFLLCPYHRYYYKYEEMMSEQIKKYEKGKTRAEEVIEYEKSLFEKYKDPNLAEKPSELELRGGAHYSDVACDVITSIWNDEGKIHTVNVKNNGHVKNIEIDDTIEISCKLTSKGAVPLKDINYLPRTIKGIYELFKSYEIAVCEAAIKKDYDLALLAMNLNPFTRSDDKNEKLLDLMLSAPTNVKHLTGFQKNKGK